MRSKLIKIASMSTWLGGFHEREAERSKLHGQRLKNVGFVRTLGRSLKDDFYSHPKAIIKGEVPLFTHTTARQDKWTEHLRKQRESEAKADGKRKHSSAALGGGIGALLGVPGATVGAAIGAKENHRGHAAASAGLGALGGGLAAAGLLAGLAALATHRPAHMSFYRGPYTGNLYTHYRPAGHDAHAVARSGVLGAGLGTILGGALGGHHSDQVHGKKHK